MRKKSVNNNISAEVLAAFLDGNATTQECQMIFNALSEDAELRELFHISQLVDSHFHLISQKLELLPMTALAATCEENNLCSLECDKYVLRKRHLDFDEHLLLENAIQEGWQKENGTALHNIGRNLEKAGLIVERRYKCTISDVVEALNQGDDVIAAIDGGELIKNQWCELKEDLFVGQIPDHVVVVLACNLEERIITLYDPNKPNAEDVYPIEQFVDAWKDSKNYLLTINFKEMKTYIPRPIDLSDVVLTEDLTELREAIAENAHEIWATDRQAQGWIYGPKRDEDKKKPLVCCHILSFLKKKKSLIEKWQCEP